MAGLGCIPAEESQIVQVCTCIETLGGVDHNLLVVLLLLVIAHFNTYYLLREKMGFEEAVPPVPDRLAEVKMIDRIEESWLSQPYNRYYMQEDLRRTKMEYASYNLKTRQKFLLNCLFLSVFTIPLAYLTRRFYGYSSWKSGGIPFTKDLTYFERERSVTFDRNKAANKTFVTVYLLSTSILSFHLTNWHFRSDQNYDNFAKVKKML